MASAAVPDLRVECFRGRHEDWGHLLDSLGGGSAYQHEPFIGTADRLIQVFDGETVLCGGVVVASPVLGWPKKNLALHRGPAGDVTASLGALESWARAQGAWCLEIMPDVQYDDDFRSRMIAQGWQTADAARYTLRLDLTADADALLAGLESRGRYQVKRAEREGISVRQAVSVDEVAIFCDLFAQMCAEKALIGSPREHLMRIGRYLIANPSRGAILLAAHQGAILGANLLWRSGSRVENIYGASRKQKVAVGYPLQWASVMWAKHAGAGEYDFGGYDPRATGGPALMKSAFSRNVVALSPRWRKVFRPYCYYGAQTVRGWLRR